MPAFGFNLQMGTRVGAGITTLDLVAALERQGRIEPVVLHQPGALDDVDPVHDLALSRVMARTRAVFDALPRGRPGPIVLPFPVTVPVGNGPAVPAGFDGFRGSTTIAKVVLEDTAFDTIPAALAASIDACFAVSAWNRDLLVAAGFPGVHLVPQGVDPALFHPAPRRGLWRDRFVVFSGGKLELRKGQDLVIAAFRRFHARHPESLLCVAWHNFWPDTMAGVDAAGHVRGGPAVRAGRILVGEWLRANGVPGDAFVDLGFVRRHHLPPLIREADVALFPNRAEGGTNLIAMEALACGVPTVLSANTGHLDVLVEGACYPLRAQSPVRHHPGWRGVDGWGESSVEEIVEVLEAIHRDRDRAARVGARGAAAMRGRDWNACARILSDAFG